MGQERNQLKVVLTIFCLPHEIDDLEYVVLQLKKGSLYLSKQVTWHFEITVCTSSTMVDWKKSSIPKSYFFDKLSRLYQLTDWCSRYFQTSDSILGSLSQKVFSLNRNPDADYYLWLDSDIVFDEKTLSIIESAIISLHGKHRYFFMTPEIVKIWDKTWDCLVNEKFINKPYGYQANNDPYIDCGVKGKISVEPVINSIPKQPRFKFGSGFFACLSRDLLSRIGLPKSFGQYGLEDTFIMWASEKLVKERDLDITQFKIKNLVVCENYKYRNYKQYENHLTMINRKDEFKQISEKNFSEELKIIQ